LDDEFVHHVLELFLDFFCGVDSFFVERERVRSVIDDVLKSEWHCNDWSLL
jgi:hypothetical protein